MITPEERDYIGEVIAEDAALRDGRVEGVTAELVPSAGGEVEVIYMLRNNALRTQWRDADREAFDSAAGLFEYERRELVDHAHVTRLQAENAALQQRLNFADQRVDELTADNARLQAELERLTETDSAYDDAICASNELGYACMSAGDVVRAQANELVSAQSELTKALELLEEATIVLRAEDIHNLPREIDEFLAHQSAPAANPVFNDPLYNAESDARNAAAMLEEVLELFDDGVGRSAEEFKLMRRIGNWLGRSTPDSEESGDECAHSEANKIGCPECGEVFKR